MLCETTYDDMNDVEEFVRSGSECPALSLGLRERIIAEAVTAQVSAVRQARRGRAGVVLGLSLALALFVGRQPLLANVPIDALLYPLSLQKVEDALNPELTEPVSLSVNAPDRVAWSQVELMYRVRRWQGDTLRTAFAS
jgi:hypothetical protein